MKNTPIKTLTPFLDESQCPLCKADTTLFLHQRQRDYRQCPNCSLIFVPPRFFLPSEEEKKRYLEHENSLENAGYVKMFQEKIDILKTVCPRVRKVLDYGCGYEPVLTTLLSREGYAVDGYDLIFFPQCQLEPVYDLIVSIETFEHFKKPGIEIDKLVSLLKSTGYLAVMTHFYSKDDSPSREQFQSWYYQRDPTHIAFYSLKTFAWIAKDKGLKIIYNNEKNFIILKRSLG